MLCNKTVYWHATYECALRMRKQTAAHDATASLGVTHTTPTAYFSDAWDVWGDERTIVLPTTREFILQQLLLQQERFSPSVGVINLAAQFISHYAGMPELHDACTWAKSYEGDAGKQGQCAKQNQRDSGIHTPVQGGIVEPAQLTALSVDEVAFLQLVARYFDYLDAHNLLELGQAVAVLDWQQYDIHASFWVDNTATCTAAMQCFLDARTNRIEDAPEVITLPHEVEARYLFPAGPSAQNKLIQDTILSLVAQVCGNDFSVLVLCANPLQAYETLGASLAREGYSIVLRSSKRFIETQFGKAFWALWLLKNQDVAWQQAATDFAFSPYSGISAYNAEQFDSYIRSHRACDANYALLFLRNMSPHCAYFEELFSEPDAGIVLDYFIDLTKDDLHLSPAACAEQVAAISALRGVYEAARSFTTDIEALIPFVNELAVPLSCRVDALDNALGGCITFADISYAKSALARSYTAVVLADATDEFYSVQQRQSSLDLLAEKLILPLKLQKSAYMHALIQRGVSAAQRIVALSIPERTKQGEVAYAAFFYRELTEAQLDAEAINVQTRGEELFAENTLLSHGNEHGFVAPKRGESRLLLCKHEQHLPMVVSPSAVEAYRACPYNWFISRVIRPEAPDGDFGPLQKGLFAHEVFRRFYEYWRQHGYARVNPEQIDEAQEVFAHIIDTFIEEQMAQSLNDVPEVLVGIKPNAQESQTDTNQTGSSRASADQKGADQSGDTRQTDVAQNALIATTQAELLELERFKKTLLDNLEMQARFMPDAHPASFELPITINDAVDYAGARLVGRIDRVDVLSDASRFVVIDYKGSLVGHAAGVKEDDIDTFELPHKIQTLMYAQALRKLHPNKHCAGALYVSYQAKSDKAFAAGSYASLLNIDDFTTATSRVDINFDAYLDAIEQRLEPVIQELTRGKIEPNPARKQACMYCPVPYCEWRLS